MDMHVNYDLSGITENEESSPWLPDNDLDGAHRKNQGKRYATWWQCLNIESKPQMNKS